MGQAWRDALNAYRDQMGNFKIDQVKIQEEVRRSVEQARRAMEDALRYSTNVASEADLQGPQRTQEPRGHADTGSSVTVRSSGDRVRSIVKADESGTIVIVSNPKPHLTVHDKEGKLRV